MLDIVSLCLSFYLRYLYKAYVARPVTTTTNNSSPFFQPLMDDKNLRTEALFSSQIFDSIQALPH